MAFPGELCRLWDLEKGQVVRLLINGNGEVIVKKADSKPPRKRMTYEEWLEKITTHIPIDGPGKIYRQIVAEAGLTMKAAPAEWVHKAENDIHLKRTLDKQTHRIVWTRTIKIDVKHLERKETKPRDPTLAEF